ncbi:MAG: glycosyltransferase [bacterium]|nr:glycosyltransferase [bacterium]
MPEKNQPKIAIVTDWLTTYGGAEKVVLAVSEIFPDAPIFTSQYSEKEVKWFEDKDIRTGWVNFFSPRLRKFLGVFRAIYFSRLDLSEYDVVISICCAESKAIKTRNDQLHVSYLQGPPTQYYWAMFDDYVKNPGFGKLNFLVRFFFKLLVKPLRNLDYKFAQRPDFLVANSTYSQDEIAKYYGRESQIIFPPVDAEKFEISSETGDYFISTSRQVNWKRLDLAVEVFKKNGVKLKLVGTGAEHEKLKNLAENSPNIEFISPIHDTEKLSQIVAEAHGFVFPSLEPFGIAPIEALSAGVPVVAFSQGGARDYIIEGKNGVFFDEQTVESLEEAIKKFEKINFDKKEISKTAKKFSEDNFKKYFAEFVNGKISEKLSPEGQNDDIRH